jgi:hypothetical protein
VQEPNRSALQQGRGGCWDRSEFKNRTEQGEDWGDETGQRHVALWTFLLSVSRVEPSAGDFLMRLTESIQEDSPHAKSGGLSLGPLRLRRVCLGLWGVERRERVLGGSIYRLCDRGVHGSFAGDHILLLLMGFAAERRANLDFLGTGGTAGPKIMGTISLSCIAHRRASAPTASAMEHC